MRPRVEPFVLVLLLAVAGAAFGAPDWLGNSHEARTQRMRDRIALYLRALDATPEEQERLRKEDTGDGIFLMQRNPFMRSRMRLVALLSPAEREAILKGNPYVSPPFAKLPRKVQTLMEEVLAVHRLPTAKRDRTRYRLERRESDGADHLMVNIIDADTGRAGSGGSVMPGFVLKRR